VIRTDAESEAKLLRRQAEEQFLAEKEKVSREAHDKIEATFRADCKKAEI
jgi:vacuolar-type H+-ATPase subunit E/Vma4